MLSSFSRYLPSLFIIMFSSFNLLICLRMFDGLIPSKLRFSLSLILYTSVFISVGVNEPLLFFMKRNNMSTIISLESPGCNNPKDKHSRFISSLPSRYFGFSYFLRVILDSGLSDAIFRLITIFFLFECFQCSCSFMILYF